MSESYFGSVLKQRRDYRAIRTRRLNIRGLCVVREEEWGTTPNGTALTPGPVAVGMPAEDGRRTNRMVQLPLTGLNVKIGSPPISVRVHKNESQSHRLIVRIAPRMKFSLCLVEYSSRSSSSSISSYDSLDNKRKRLERLWPNGSSTGGCFA